MKTIIDQVISKETAKLFYKENYTYPVEYVWVGDRLISLLEKKNIIQPQVYAWF